MDSESNEAKISSDSQITSAEIMNTPGESAQGSPLFLSLTLRTVMNTPPSLT